MLTVTGQSSYLNGLYYASASSYTHGAGVLYYSPDKLFTNTSSSNYTNIWYINPGPSDTFIDISGISRAAGSYTREAYSGSPYVGGGPSQYYYTTTAGGSNYNGEWVQIRFPFRFLVTSISLKGRTGAFQRMLATAYLLGSNDANTWILLYSINQSGQPGNLDYTLSLPNTYSNSYTYFRLVASSLAGSNGYYLNFAQWYLTGYPYA